MEKRTQFIVAAVLGVVAFGLNRMYLTGAIDDATQKLKTKVSLAKTATGISAGTKLQPQHLVSVDVPAGYAPVSAVKYADRNVFFGQEVGVDVAKGDYLMENYFPSGGKTFVGNKLSDQIDNDQFRALTLPVDETNSLARSIVSGDHIDIQYTVAVPGTPERASFLFLQDVPILATGSFSAADSDGRGGQKRYGTVTVLLPIQDAMRLSFARQSGSINVLLRGAKRGEQSTVVDVPPISGIKDILNESQRQTVEKLATSAITVRPPDMSDRVKGQLRELLEKERTQQQQSH